MKKFFYLITALALCTSNAKAFDYEPEEGLTWMGLLGVNISSLQSHDYNAKTGAQAGFRADYVLPYAHGAYVTAGLDWTMKGGKISNEKVVGNDNIMDATSKYTLHYVEIPVRLGFRYNITESFGVFGEVGPYFAVGVGGQHSMSLDGDGTDVRKAEDEMTFNAFTDSDDLSKRTFQRWDAGVGFRVGVEFNEHYNLMLGCDWGLADIYRDSLRDLYYEANKTRLSKVHNFNLSMTVGYRF